MAKATIEKNVTIKLELSVLETLFVRDVLQNFRGNDLNTETATESKIRKAVWDATNEALSLVDLTDDN